MSSNTSATGRRAAEVMAAIARFVTRRDTPDTATNSAASVAASIVSTTKRSHQLSKTQDTDAGKLTESSSTKAAISSIDTSVRLLLRTLPTRFFASGWGDVEIFRCLLRAKQTTFSSPASLDAALEASIRNTAVKLDKMRTVGNVHTVDMTFNSPICAIMPGQLLHNRNTTAHAQLVLPPQERSASTQSKSQQRNTSDGDTKSSQPSAATAEADQVGGDEAKPTVPSQAVQQRLLRLLRLPDIAFRLGRGSSKTDTPDHHRHDSNPTGVERADKDAHVNDGRDRPASSTDTLPPFATEDSQHPYHHPIYGDRPPVCFVFAGTGEHRYQVRRMRIAAPLAEKHGIASIIIEHPFYGRRKPESQLGSTLMYASDLFVMGLGLVAESVLLRQWCQEHGFGPVVMHGFSLGGFMSSISASLASEPVGLVACLSAISSSRAFTDGALSNSVAWSTLANQLPKLRRELEPEFPSIFQGMDDLDTTEEQARHVFTNLTDHLSGLDTFPPLQRQDLCTIVTAEKDGYIPLDTQVALQELWPQCRRVSMEGGHITSYLLGRGEMLDEIKGCVDRVVEATQKGDHARHQQHPQR